MRKPVVVAMEIAVACALTVGIAWFGTINFKLTARVVVSCGALAVAFVAGYAAKGGERR